MKFNKKMLFGTIGQLIFAIFVIVAMYATGFDHYSAAESGANKTITLNDFDANSLTGLGLTDWGKNIYGLGIASIVIVFITIVLPFISMFVSNDTMNKYFGISALVLDVVVLALTLAAFGLYTSKAIELTKNVEGQKPFNNAGYIAGSFIFSIVGAGLGIAGNAVSYKEYLAK